MADLGTQTQSTWPNTLQDQEVEEVSSELNGGKHPRSKTKWQPPELDCWTGLPGPSGAWVGGIGRAGELEVVMILSCRNQISGQV